MCKWSDLGAVGFGSVAVASASGLGFQEGLGDRWFDGGGCRDSFGGVDLGNSDDRGGFNGFEEGAAGGESFVDFVTIEAGIDALLKSVDFLMEESDFLFDAALLIGQGGEAIAGYDEGDEGAGESDAEKGGDGETGDA